MKYYINFDLINTSEVQGLRSNQLINCNNNLITFSDELSTDVVSIAVLYKNKP